MSLDATVWAWKQRIKQNCRTSRSAVKIVLLSLADRADEKHRCFPSISRLEQDTELNRKTILNAMRYLEEFSVIRDTGLRKGKTKKVKVYELIGVEGREPCAEQEAGEEGNSPENGTIKDSMPETPAMARGLESQEDNSPERGTVIKNRSETGTVKQSRIRNDTENGIVPNLPANRPKNGSTKQAQIWDSELPSIELPNEPSCASGSGSAERACDAWVSEKGKTLTKSQQHVFSTLWEAYRYKQSRARAIDEFVKVIWPFFGRDPKANNRNLAFFLEAIKKTVESRKSDPDYTPLHFERWIKRRRWEDDFSQDERMSNGLVSDENRGNAHRPYWERAGFDSFDHFEKHTEVCNALKLLIELKKPSIREQQRIRDLKDQLKELRPQKKSEECAA